MDIFKLQNGSDIRGIALNGVLGEEVNLTNEVSFKIANAFAVWLKKKTNKKNVVITIGRDSRLSGESLAMSCIKISWCSFFATIKTLDIFILNSSVKCPHN